MAFIGPAEALLIVAAVLVLVFGPKKLPELARSLGLAKKEFHESMAEADDAKQE